ncbi:cytochrome c [Bradyrhizobium jicamae]|uniref:Cytochrome c n=1 Tax=Bradyrhizobium jicamae TaxID=280332 RepID=A0ABS5FNN0_9BRAD|nr:cytochrome c [Bradyrhizobium jicamae]MBR0797941.1 cytochrome c [Bradyrhizobium jicamae]
MRRKTIIIIGLLVVAGLAYFKDDLETVVSGFNVKAVDYQPPTKTVWLDQKVSAEQLSWFYHADQGTRTFLIPHEWFMALEQPTIPWLLFTAEPPLSDINYLARFGFIPDTVIPGKPDPLPIGFAHGTAMLDANGAPWRNPRSKTDMTGIGLTCAACHTGSFTYRGTEIVIDGGPANTNLFEFQKAVGVSLFLTRFWPGRFSRFADQILGKDAGLDDRMALRGQLDLVLKQYANINNLEAKVAANSVEEGYARLDALNRIGNQVFAIDLNNPNNYASHSAPVHFPRIWNAPWFSWVQYDGSIMQPMVRNAGESLGVSAELNLLDPARGLFKSSSRVDVLYDMERMIAGDPPSEDTGFGGLASPKWPENILPAINMDLAKKGGDLYKAHCQGCHGPAIDSKALPASEAFALFKDHKRWIKNSAGQPLLDVEMVPISHIGTDSAQADGLASRTVETPPNLGIKDTGFGFALRDLVVNTVNYWYDQNNTAAADRERINGYRPPGIQAPIAYKVRPLNGIWATPPYLHNGSVPSIYALLSPVKDRPAQFWLGSREYDARDLGYVSNVSIKNGFLLDTTKQGNSNSGHEFSSAKHPGVIGPELKEDERRALIEFIKTL